MNWKPFVRYVSVALGFFFAGIGLVGIPAGFQDLHFQLLPMLDETGVRIAYAFLGVLLLIGPDYYLRFKKRRGKKLARERRKSIEYVEATGIIDSYIHAAIKDKRDKIQLLIRRAIFDSFEKNCPEGMRGDGVYDGDILEKWIRHNAIKILVAHYGELGPLE